MGEHEVLVVKVEIIPHDKADRLELAKVGDYISVVKKGQFKTGDLAIYIPDDSVVPERIEKYLAEQNKISLHGGRIRCAKIRGVFSEGLCLTTPEWLEDKDAVEGKDVAEILGVTKYEPPEPTHQGIKNAKGVNFNHNNPNFPEYYCVKHFKKYPSVLKDEEYIAITVKFHGTNARAGIVKKPKAKTLLGRLARLLVPQKEYLVGSHNKIKKLTANAIRFDARKTDTYWRAADKYELEKYCRIVSKENKNADVIFYFEVVGLGIQKGYGYGVPEGDIEIRVFDIMIDGQYQDWDYIRHKCKYFKLPCVEEVYRGPFNREAVYKHADAIDEYNGKKHNREGVVIRPMHERKDPHCGRVILKLISEKYKLDKSNSDFH